MNFQRRGSSPNTEIELLATADEAKPARRMPRASQTAARQTPMTFLDEALEGEGAQCAQNNCVECVVGSPQTLFIKSGMNLVRVKLQSMEGYNKYVF